MIEFQARELLTQKIHGLQRKHEDELLRLAGDWPLLLRLVNRQLRYAIKRRWDVNAIAAKAAARLSSIGPWGLDPRDGNPVDPVARRKSVKATVEASLRMLDCDRDRVLELAIFPEDTDIPADTVAVLWQARAGLTALDADWLCQELADLAIVEYRLDQGKETLKIHDDIRRYLRHENGPDQLIQCHEALLSASAALWSQSAGQTPWWKLPQGHYLWRHLAYHLKAAGHDAERANLVINPRWVTAKLRQFGAFPLLADIGQAGTPVAITLRRVLIQVAHLLTPTKPDHAVLAILATYLNGHPELQDLADFIERELSGVPHLVSRRLQLDLPDPALLAVLAKPQDRGEGGGAVFSLQGWLAYNAEDGCVWIWTPATGVGQKLTEKPATIDMRSVSPNGRWLVLRGQSGGFRVFDTSVSSDIHDWRGRTLSQTATDAYFLFSPDNRWMASVGDRDVKIFNPESWEVVSSFAHGDRNARVWCAFSANGNWFAAYSAKVSGKANLFLGRYGKVRVWQIPRDRSIWSYKHKTMPRWVRWNYCGVKDPIHTVYHNQELIALDSHHLWYWTAMRTKRLRMRTERGGISPNQFGWPQTIIGVRYDGTVHVPYTEGADREESESALLARSDYLDDVCLWDFPGPLAVAPDGTWLATNGHEHKIIILTLPGLRTVAEVVLNPRTFGVKTLSIAPDGDTIASVDLNGAIQLWSKSAAQAAKDGSAEHSDQITAIHDKDGTAAVNPHRSQRRQHADSGTAQHKKTAVPPSPETSRGGPDLDATEKLGRLTQQDSRERDLSSDELTDKIQHKASSHRRDWELTLDAGPTITVRDKADGEIRIEIPAKAIGWARGCSPWSLSLLVITENNLLYRSGTGSYSFRVVEPLDGSWVAFSTISGIEMWDTTTWTMIRKLGGWPPVNLYLLMPLYVTSDGSALICSDPLGRFTVFDTSTGRELFCAGDGALSRLRRLLRNQPSTSTLGVVKRVLDKVAKLWLIRYATNVLIKVFPPLPLRGIHFHNCLVTSYYGDWVAIGGTSVGYDHRVFVLDVRSGAIQVNIPYNWRLGGVAFTANGRWLVTVSNEQLTAVDTTTWKRNTKLDGFPKIQGWAINPCGTMVAAVIETNTIHIYRTDDWQLLTQMRVEGNMNHNYGRGIRWQTDTRLIATDISIRYSSAKDIANGYKYDTYLLVVSSGHRDTA